MYEKLIKVAKHEGFCCIWAFLEAHRQTTTSTLVRIAKDAGFPLSARAIRHQRRAYRQRLLECQSLTSCLQSRLKASRTTA